MAGKRLSTNDVSIAFAKEATFGTSPPSGEIWRLTEPNEIANFGGTITTVARTPISPDRQQRKSITTDFEAGVDITSDLTVDEVQNWAAAFCLAGQEGNGITYKDIAASGAGFALGSAYKTKLIGETSDKWDLKRALVFSKGFRESINNGIHLVTSVATSGIITVSTSTESEPKSLEKTVSVVGYRGETGLLKFENGYLTWATSATPPTNGWETLGLKQGHWIYVGGDPEITQFIVNTDINGWHKIISISGTNSENLYLEGLSGTTDGAAQQTIEIYFGSRWHNVPTNDANYQEDYFRFEATYRELGVGDNTAYEYITGCAPNVWTINFPLTDKATSQSVFVAKDALPIVEAAARETGAATALVPYLNKAFNTSTDFARLSFIGSSGDDLSSFIKEIEIVITNNFAAEKVLSLAGAAFMNLGTLEVKGTIQALFTDKDLITSIRDNETVRIRSVLRNEDGAVLFEMPSATLGGGAKEFTLNETVKISLDTSCYRDDIYGDSINIQVFHYLPIIAGGV